MQTPCLSVQAASKMSAFPPTDLVLAAPTFSRCLYAQLALQQYAPPRNYPMPMPTDPQASVEETLAACFAVVYKLALPACRQQCSGGLASAALQQSPAKTNPGLPYPLSFPCSTRPLRWG